MAYSDPMREKHCQHKCSAIQRGIAFELTFEQWRRIWVRSGKYHLRGCRKGQYVMARKGDAGAYAVGNVRIVKQEANHIEAQKGKVFSDTTRQRMREAGRKKVFTPAHCEAIRQAALARSRKRAGQLLVPA